MSEPEPESDISSIVRVVKLISGDEIVCMVGEADKDKIIIKYPAKMQAFMARNTDNEYLELIKLTNYLMNIDKFEVTIPRSSVIYMGRPMKELVKMYNMFVVEMQTDPKSIISSHADSNLVNPNNGLQLLNDLFNNEDFVEFVNELIETYEGVEIELDEDNDVIEPPVKEEPKAEQKPKKRHKARKESSKLPYNPDANPNSAEAWSDNPNDYT